jgi:hypothetical protein
MPDIADHIGDGANRFFDQTAGSSRAGVCRRMTEAGGQILQVNQVALLLAQGEPAHLRAGQVREDTAG